MNLAITALLSAVLCVVSPFTVPIGTVPISLTTMFIIVGVYMIGPLKMSLSVLIYLLLGAIGLPVFANFKSGVGILAGPTGGYMVGYIILTLVGGAIINKDINNARYAIAGTIIGNVLVYTVGTVWLAFSMNLTFKEGLLIGVAPFIITDAIKMFGAVTLGRAIRRRLK